MLVAKSIKNSLKNLQSALPIMAGVLMLVSFFNLFANKYYDKIFTGNKLLDPFLGGIAGSISFGIPITSYIVGGELFKKGISLLAITAFIMSWTTVGVAMLPLEAKFLGKRFALARNLINFIFSILIAIVVVFTLQIF